ncbi:alpha/beta fold hydrolase [Dyadobacter aurulentus]|uniref:alpha/beta fold hydrolase n=1 Tax=Dyadobacter sp. UC 10 TaxID=2605428 RepID=UPI0011F208E6|nr:alpha/beta hydrolase [Dyadobacter sp. UC 10]KAA0990097.1 alpha/beta hydrolase [Dyadobacter sp. UC 10]
MPPLKRTAFFVLLAFACFSAQYIFAKESTPASKDSPKMNVYFLSGLGADKRVFSRLKLDDDILIHHIEWIKPAKKETIAQYAQRLLPQIDTTKPFQLVGVSFGGMIASEIAEIVKPERIIIISSTSTGIPVSGFYRGLTKFLLLSPFAGPVLKSANKITYKYFGATTPEAKSLLRDILHDTDTKFLKWALARTGSWEKKQRAENLYHIHGDQDRLIPVKLVKPDTVIAGGGHLMVFSQAAEISAILNKKLKGE